MTTMAEHMPKMSVDEFEKFAAVETETVRLEFIGGRIGAKKLTDGDHGAITMWLLRLCMQARPDLDLNPTQGLKVEAYRKGRARPDGTLAPVAHFAGQPDWADPEGVLMTVEITSYDSDTDHRDRVEKPPAYAAAGIPVYLLIDRESCEVAVFSKPDRERGKYGDVHKVDFGARITLPEPVGIELDTEILKNYVR
ncbi:Uma2 family endonuclease [Streptomyces sp. CA-294286]|uniref:Uma2 family endonuclease n=1 Tax=Streptomyces sp. CA-294286 TaxID=3240070 RepID=UPI003D94A6A0